MLYQGFITTAYHKMLNTTKKTVKFIDTAILYMSFQIFKTNYSHITKNDSVNSY